MFGSTCLSPNFFQIQFNILETCRDLAVVS